MGRRCAITSDLRQSIGFATIAYLFSIFVYVGPLLPECPFAEQYPLLWEETGTPVRVGRSVTLQNSEYQKYDATEITNTLTSLSLDPGIVVSVFLGVLLVGGQRLGTDEDQ